MENIQFKSDSDSFECRECEKKISVAKASISDPRPVSCEKCGTEYEVLKRKSGPGLEIMMRTASETDAESAEEAELEEEDEENPEEEK
ncbi:MAG: hypothetical protein J4431_03445 [Candidatus Aenigmarchaeota archaeon]|nr:hypothetical protein [Candidatus Aenigmarchaeota archaeon]